MGQLSAKAEGKVEVQTREAAEKDGERGSGEGTRGE